jgi:hypothetical protein
MLLIMAYSGLFAQTTQATNWPEAQDWNEWEPRDKMLYVAGWMSGIQTYGLSFRNSEPAQWPMIIREMDRFVSMHQRHIINMLDLYYDGGGSDPILRRIMTLR